MIISSFLKYSCNTHQITLLGTSEQLVFSRNIFLNLLIIAYLEAIILRKQKDIGRNNSKE